MYSVYSFYFLILLTTMKFVQRTVPLQPLLMAAMVMMMMMMMRSPYVGYHNDKDDDEKQHVSIRLVT